MLWSLLLCVATEYCSIVDITLVGVMLRQTEKEHRYVSLVPERLEPTQWRLFKRAIVDVPLGC